MPPCYPQANTTAKIIRYARDIFQEEIEGARKNFEQGWDKLFSRYNPFQEFNKFITIKTELRLKGMVSTKIIRLMSKLEEKCRKIRLLPEIFSK